ncbi:MAG: 30S ribosomal protein S4 [Parcubacteria group bacterium GW2011_GWA2_38_13]|nr:MAG: 30S ribosomal protein S4 [Parcubacteria group bacterium GW2011_GWA2_38_13]
MSRYLGPKHKLCRREGVKLCDSPKCPVIKRNYPPGVHGPKGAPRLTPFGEQLREKQKARRLYSIQEKQFRNYFKKAIKLKGDTGNFIIGMLEKRLDNVIYRLGIAKTRAQARQLVSHGFITINEKKVNIPSYEVKIKDIVGISKSKINKKVFLELDKQLKKSKSPSWIHFDMDKKIAKVTEEPNVADMKNIFNVQSIVEFYSR